MLTCLFLACDVVYPQYLISLFTLTKSRLPIHWIKYQTLINQQFLIFMYYQSSKNHIKPLFLTLDNNSLYYEVADYFETWLSKEANCHCEHFESQCQLSPSGILSHALKPCHWKIKDLCWISKNLGGLFLEVPVLDIPFIIINLSLALLSFTIQWNESMIFHFLGAL